MGRKSYSGCSWTVPCNPGLAALCNATVNVYAPPCGIGASWCGVPPCGLPCGLPCPPCGPLLPSLPPPFLCGPGFPRPCGPYDCEKCETDFVGLSTTPVSIEPTVPLSQRKYTITFTEVRDTNDNLVDGSLFVSNFTGCYKIIATVPLSVESVVLDPTYASISINVNGVTLYTTPALVDMTQGTIYTINIDETIYINNGDIVTIDLNLGEEYTYTISPGNSTRIFSGTCATDCC